MEAVAELDFESPRTRGRAKRDFDCEYVRDLGPADIALLASERGIQAKPVQRLRDRHHALARCLAQGMTDSEASAVTGYDPSRISILKGSPDFASLVAHYRKVEDSLLGEFVDRATTLTLTAMNELQDRLEEAPTEVSSPMLLEIVKTGADRIGHAPVAKSVNINANVNLGDRLQAARKRVAVAGTEAGRLLPIAGRLTPQGALNPPQAGAVEVRLQTPKPEALAAVAPEQEEVRTARQED